MNEYKTVVCGFPGVGKSHLAKINGWHDSDSSAFSWRSPGVQHPEFPANYIDHIASLSGVVLASSHDIVRGALVKAGIPYWLCYPRMDCRDEYIERYRVRGSSSEFIKLLDKMWCEWITGMETDVGCVGRWVLGPGEFMSDVIRLEK